MFEQIKGQDAALALLKNSLKQGRISQAYLFHGNDGVGKFMSALYFGMALNCLSEEEKRPCGVCGSCHKFLSFEHPDFIYLFPTTNLKLSIEGEIKDKDAAKEYEAYINNKINTPWQEYFFSGNVEIRRDSMSHLIKRLELSRNEGRYRVVIIEDADKMNVQTANAFLKTLEEPPPFTVIILITEHLPKLLPTIISRCEPVYFKPLPQKVIRDILMQDFGVEEQMTKSIAKISGGNLKIAIRLCESGSGDIRDQAFAFFEMVAQDKAVEFLSSLSRRKQSVSEIVDKISNIKLIANDLALVHLAEEEISNIDKLEFIRLLSNEAIIDRLPEYLLYLDELSQMLLGNVNPTLAQLGLYNATVRLLKR